MLSTMGAFISYKAFGKSNYERISWFKQQKKTKLMLFIAQRIAKGKREEEKK